MPRIFRIGGYTVYFWTNEGSPTAIAIIMRAIEARADEIISAWEKYFGEVRFYC